MHKSKCCVNVLIVKDRLKKNEDLFLKVYECQLLFLMKSLINCISQAIKYWANLVKSPHNAQAQRMPVYVLMAYVSVMMVMCCTNCNVYQVHFSQYFLSRNLLLLTNASE